MEAQSYGYTAQSKRGNIDYVYRPLIDVIVGSEKESRTFKALVDSGTDITVMDKTIAQLLMISADNRDPGHLSGIGNWKPGFIAPISLKIPEFPERTFNFNVLFIENLSENFEIILGQHDFFLNFNVIFKRSKKTFHLELVS